MKLTFTPTPIEVEVDFDELKEYLIDEHGATPEAIQCEADIVSYINGDDDFRQQIFDDWVTSDLYVEVSNCK
jgi:hypothetical protein